MQRQAAVKAKPSCLDCTTLLAYLTHHTTSIPVMILRLNSFTQLLTITAKQRHRPVRPVEGEHDRLKAGVGPDCDEAPCLACCRICMSHGLVQLPEGDPVRRVLEAGCVKYENHVLLCMVAPNWTEMPITCRRSGCVTGCCVWGCVELLYSARSRFQEMPPGQS